MASMKIAIIRPHAAPMSLNSYNSQELGLAKGLAKLSIDVDVFMAGDSNDIVLNQINIESGGVIRIYQLPFIKMPLIGQGIYPQLAGMIIKNKYHFVQVNEKHELTTFLIVRLCKKLRIPVVIYHGMYKNMSGRIVRGYGKIFNFLLLPYIIKNISFAFAKTQRAQRFLQEHHFKMTSIMPVGLDDSVFVDMGKNWYEQLDINDDEKIVLYIGVFEPRRNIDFMLDVAKYCGDEKIKFVFVGTGPDYEKANNRIIEEKIQNAVLVGPVPQKFLSNLYQSSHLFLLPSQYEIYGMVVIESMYFGVPVISTKTAGPEDIIEHQVDGLLMDEINVVKWGDEIKKLIFDERRLSEMSLKAKSKIRNHYSWDYIAKKYYNDYILPICNNNF